MFFKKLLALSAALFISGLMVSGCGPVQFSANSEESVDPNGETPVTPNPTNPNPNPNPNPKLRDVRYTNVVAAKDNKLDIVLIVDDSNSMLADNRKLANRLNGFVTKLQSSNIDWQMCATVTSALPVGNSYAWGASFFWQSSAVESQSLGMVLKKGTPNLHEIFYYTIEYIGAGWQNSDDERGIKAAYHHVYNGDLTWSGRSGCYRQDSAVAYIIISDEDERSVGGDPSQVYYANELKPLEREDMPEVFVSFFKQTFGENKRFTVNSIIVKPNDTVCKAAQDKEGAISHYGFKYAELSNLTGGGIGSICDSDYYTNLNLFVDRIEASLSSLPLECVPYQGNVSVSITPSMGSVTSKVQGMNLVFSSAIPAGRTIDIRYQCDDNARLPSSVIEVSQPVGFFAKVWNFIKALF